MPNQVAEVLRKALEAFGPNGEHWTQFSENDGRGNMCSYGAVRKIIPYNSPEHELAASAIKALRSSLGNYCIAEWNDSRERTFSDVKALFEKAIAQAEKSHA